MKIILRRPLTGVAESSWNQWPDGRGIRTGDIAGYGADLDHTVALLLEHDCQAVLGNHEIWHLTCS